MAYKHILLVSPTVDDMELRNSRSSSLMISPSTTAALFMEVY